MVVDLSKYDGDSFEAALDVFYGVMDDLKTQAADGRLTLTALETYRSQIVRETYSKLAGMKQSGSGLQDSPKQSRRLQRLQGRGLRRRDTGQRKDSRAVGARRCAGKRDSQQCQQQGGELK